ncbi:MAG: hypothetical protein HZA23_06020 [Nitrospirae bacterium]|nr:hypothetical protein [Nitrospirota bacterium]
MIDLISQWTGLGPTGALVALVVAAALLAWWAWRNFWGVVKFLLIAALLAGAAYIGYELIQAGTAVKKSTVREKSVEKPIP